MSDATYALLLDLFPLTDQVMDESAVLGAAIQQAGLALIADRSAQRAEELAVLISLARDLGYLGEDVSGFLLRNVESLRV